MSARILRKWQTWVIAAVAVVLLVTVVAPFVYIQFIKGDPPERLSFEDAGTSGSEPVSDALDVSLDGMWMVATGSQAGYRVGEVLFGQDTEAVGRTESVTGQLELGGTTVSSAEFTVDMTEVSSDESQRDDQFHGRIMDTETYPTATFALTEPIDLGSLPDDLEELTVTATGELTLRGVTKTVTFDLVARRNRDVIEVNGSIPVSFDDFEIRDASGGPATVKREGEVEFLLVFELA
jgi:polyisoprenoid-binding protein YceI